jgi:hypothetical protein
LLECGRVACEGNTGEDGTRKEQELAIAEKKASREKQLREYEGVAHRKRLHSLTHSLSLSLLHKRDETQKADYTLWEFTPWMKNDHTFSWMKIM